MNRKIILLVATFMLLLASGYASTVTRSISPATVQPGADVTVTLSVDVTDGATYYAIDEMPPSGWTVKDEGTGSSVHEGRLKLLVIEDAANMDYTYVLTAPSSGTGSFSGTYMFEGDSGEISIGGASSVTVSTGGELGPGPAPTTAPDYTLPIVAALVIIVIAVVAYKKMR